MVIVDGKKTGRRNKRCIIASAIDRKKRRQRDMTHIEYLWFHINYDDLTPNAESETGTALPGLLLDEIIKEKLWMVFKYQDHSPATSLWTSNASFIDCPVDCEPGAMLEPASTSVALAMPTGVRSWLPGCGAGAAANAPKDSVHSITAASAILLFLMIVILLFVADNRTDSLSPPVLNSIDPDHIFVRPNIYLFVSNWLHICQQNSNYEEIMETISFYKKQNKRPKIIMPLIAKFKTIRPEYPAWKYYIL